jgi:hypothetical protein
MQGLFREWPKVVEQFIHKQLTYTSDRLPAITGIAGIRHKQTAERYSGGLWEFDIPYQLLWFSDHDNAGANPISRHPEHASAMS